MSTELDKKDKIWIQIDQNVGLVVCSVSVFSFAIAVSGWIILFSNINDMKSRIEYGQLERESQILDLKHTVQNLQTRMHNIYDKLERIDANIKARSSQSLETQCNSMDYEGKKGDYCRDNSKKNGDATHDRAR